MNSQTYELWYSEKNDSYSFFASDNLVKNQLDDHVLIWQVQAGSWKEACRLYGEYVKFQNIKVSD